jgi:hypothetical protein
MALLPLIPQKPADRLETREQYERRRAAIAQNRRLADEFSRWSRLLGDDHLSLMRDIYYVDPFRGARRFRATSSSPNFSRAMITPT